MTLIEHQGQLIWKKYFYPTEETKDAEFYTKMNKMIAELEELNRLKDAKEKEIE